MLFLFFNIFQMNKLTDFVLKTKAIYNNTQLSNIPHC